MNIKTVESMGKIEFLAIVNTLLVTLVLLLLFTFSVNAIIGEDNVTVITNLSVGNTFPEVLNVSIMDGAASFDLTPANTTTLYCIVRMRDWNGDGDLNATNATLFHSSVGEGSSNDNNTHYFNSSCPINTTGTWGGHVDDAYTAVANCSFQVQYYANPGTWNCTPWINDSESWTETGTDDITFNSLLALGLPDIIQYGVVNATEVSNENVTNVTNYGNVPMNLSLEGYAQTRGDNLAMNCTLGNVGTIPIQYEKYNLTDSTSGSIPDLATFDATYVNLTSTAIVREFNLNFRQDDNVNDAINQTYWRIYVPRGVAGNCQGKIIFGASQAPGVPFP